MTAAKRTRSRRLGRLAGLLAIACLAFGASPAIAAQEIDMFDGATLDGAGSPVTNAGRHPDTATTKFIAKPYIPSPPAFPVTFPRELPKDVIVKLPPGLVGNPQATPSCSAAKFVADFFHGCPAESQVGYASLWLGGFKAIGNDQGLGVYTAVWNLGPANGTPAVLALNVLGVTIYATASVRSGDDYGVDISTRNIPIATNLLGTTFTIWGNPQDPSHDTHRGYYEFPGFTELCASPGFTCPAVPSTAPNVPFLSLPTSCGAPPVTTLFMSSWEHPDVFARSSFLAHDNTGPIPNPTGTDACNALDFSPTLEARPTTNLADSPSGLDVDLHTPQNEDPNGTAEAHLKDSTVTLPQGLALNPGGANGLGACSLSDMGFIGSGNEEQTVDLTGIGPFALTFEGETTSTIPGDSGAATVQSALEALPNLEPGDVDVSGESGSYAVEFTGSRSGEDVPPMSADGLSNKIQRVAVDATGGAYTLTYGASTTGNLSFATSNSTVKLNLNILPSVTSAGGSVSVTGGPGNAGASTPYYVTFNGGSFAGTDQSISATNESLFGGAESVSVTTVQAAGQPLSGTVVTTREAGHLRFTPEAASCPEAARVASAEIETPLLDHPMQGSVYLAKPFDNPFNSLVGLYITSADRQTGIVIKLAGKVELDPSTGQVRAVFDDNPQLPFEHLKLHFFGGAAGALRTPATCGTYQTTSSLTPWSAPDSGPPATPSDSWAIEQAPGGGSCPQAAGQEPNAPNLDAGSVSPVAAASTPTVVNLRRDDGTQEFSSLNLTLPPGMTGRLAGISYCPDAALAAAASKSGKEEEANPSCPASSRVGSVDVGAGAGPAPYYAKGSAYLTGPYKGAPLGMAVITPATAGPFDLGTVVVRAALHVDPNTGQITANADQIPQILQGIPLDIRSVSIRLDRPDFTRNGTSCDPLSFSGQLLSTLGQAAPLSERFQLGECSALSFKPKLGIRLTGSTRRGGHPALVGTLTMPEGGANLARAAVALPHSEFLDQGHIGTVCTRVQFAEGSGNGEHCPAASVYGSAIATSPLVDYTLEGPVYLRSSSNKLPDLVIALHGPPSQPIQVDAVARIDSIKGGIRSTFEGTPDLPVSKVVLSMAGGKKGLLQNSTNICKGVHKVTAELDGQNGKVATLTPALKNGKCGNPRKGHKRSHRAARHAAR